MSERQMPPVRCVMKWYRDLYLGERVKKKAGRIRWKVEHNAGQLGIYLLTLPTNKQNLLDIIPASNLVQKGYPKSGLFVIGIEKGYEDAAYMAASVVMEVYEKTGGFDVTAYIQKRDAQLGKDRRS